MLKKLFVVALIPICLCGCAQGKTTSAILNNISFVAEICYNDSEFVCDAVIQESTLNLTIQSPEEIKGLVLSMNKKGITGEFNGISFTPDVSSLPTGAIVKVLFKIIDYASNHESQVCDDENCKIIDRVDGYKYEFTYSPAGLPISLLVEELDLEINFKNVSVI